MYMCSEPGLIQEQQHVERKESVVPESERVVEEPGVVQPQQYAEPEQNTVSQAERVIDEISADATMDELEADIQRRLNLIKESLAKLDAPLSETSSKKG